MTDDKTQEYTFCESFGYGPKGTDYSATFKLALSEEEVAILRSFLEKNGDCDYCYLEYDNPKLFDRINDAANEAVLAALNACRRKKRLEFDDVDWSGLTFDFYWPEELLK